MRHLMPVSYTHLDVYKRQQLEGKVINVDTTNEKITVRDSNGTIHEFQASVETLQEYKAGDTIKAKLRCEK